MASMILKAGGKTLPSPTSIVHKGEIIWSASTGRNTKGDMVGDVIATKKTLTINWEWLRDADVEALNKALIAGFFEFEFPDAGKKVKLTVYRSALEYTQNPDIGDGYGCVYPTATTQLIQK